MKMKAYKGFNKDMTCRGFQFEEGKTYEEKEAKLCESGFHACENALDCFVYYVPGQSVYHEVELEDVCDERQSDDSKVCGKKIRIGAALSVADIVKAHFEYVSSRCEKVDGSVAGDNEAVSVKEKQSCSAGNRGSASAGESGSASAGNCGSASAGNRGSASAGNCGSASAGNRGSASAGNCGSASAGNCGSAVSRGSVSVGTNGCGLVRGNDVKIRGGIGALLVIAEEKKDSFDIEDWKTFVVDGEHVKANIWYSLLNGELVEADE